MYLLDTNVVSELRKAGSGKAHKHVEQWARGIPSQMMFLSAITVLEIEMGVLQMERKDAAQGALLRSWFDGRVLPAFMGRIMPVDQSVALRCALLHVPNRQSERDALIAATALVNGMTVITRNVADFLSSGVPVLNPWDKQAPSEKPAVKTRKRS